MTIQRQELMERAIELKSSVVGNYDHAVNVQDEELVDWLIEQAEKVERLEKFTIDLAGEETLHRQGEYETEMRRLFDENVRFKKALNFYVNDDLYRYSEVSSPEILADCGEEAREALKNYK